MYFEEQSLPVVSYVQQLSILVAAFQVSLAKFLFRPKSILSTQAAVSYATFTGLRLQSVIYA